MKRTKIILLILLWLTSQQTFAKMSVAMLAQDAVPHAGKHAMPVDCHSAGSVSKLHKSNTLTDSSRQYIEPVSSCCQVSCQCSAINGFAVPVKLSGPPFVSHTLSLQIPYLLVIPQAPKTSLYRPPISV